MCSTIAPYVLDNAAAEAPARLAALASMYDATTTRHLHARWVLVHLERWDRLDDEDFMMPSSILGSVWGRPDAP